MYENAVTPDYVRTMAVYNRSVNRSLYAICADLPDSERRKEFPLFFKSIHGTLNHLLWADRTWFGRFIGVPFVGPPYTQDIHADFAELQTARDKTDAEILAWAETLTPADLGGTVSWTSGLDGRVWTIAKNLCVLHMFNHQTYHRGQLSALLAQVGKDGPVTDLPWLPEFQTPAE